MIDLQAQDGLGRRVDEACDDLGRDRAQVDSLLAKLGGKFDSMIIVHEGRFREQHDHFTKVAASTAMLVNDQCTSIQELTGETFGLKIMDFGLKMVDFEPKMMDFGPKMMDFEL